MNEKEFNKDNASLSSRLELQYVVPRSRYLRESATNPITGIGSPKHTNDNGDSGNKNNTLEGKVSSYLQAISRRIFIVYVPQEKQTGVT